MGVHVPVEVAFGREARAAELADVGGGVRAAAGGGEGDGEGSDDGFADVCVGLWVGGTGVGLRWSVILQLK